MVIFCKGKDDCTECNDQMGIPLLPIVGKSKLNTLWNIYDRLEAKTYMQKFDAALELLNPRYDLYT